MRTMHVIRSTIVLSACAGMASGAAAQCNQQGADLYIGNILGVQAYGGVGGVAAYSVGPTICNNGNAPIDYAPSPQVDHPIIVQNVFRLSTVGGATRFEQVGMSWAFHTFAALQGTACCAGCAGGGVGQLQPQCSSPESASIMGQQQALGGRFDVNATTGAFTAPVAVPPGSTVIDRRLQVPIADIDPALNPTASYIIEMQGVTPDDIAANVGNNSSFRPCGFVGAGQDFQMSLTGAVAGGQPAIYAWQQADPQVVIVPVQGFGGGTIFVGARVTRLGPHQWRYEYAVQNVNCHASVRRVDVNATPDVTVSSPGFHDVAYHSGDGLGGVNVSGTDWTYSRLCAGASWSTETFAQNQNANAIRWGTLYNFRLDADTPPRIGNQDFSMYMYRTMSTLIVGVNGIPVPRRRADVDGNGLIEPADIAVFVNQWLADLQGGTLEADFDRNSAVEPADLASFVSAWLNPPGC